MSVRRQSREVTLQVLFQLEFSDDIDFRQSLDHFRQSFSFTKEVWAYAEKLLSGVLNHREAIDQKISSLAKNWSFDRISLVDKNLLRIASFEILYNRSEVDAEVSINEAIEISKKYSHKESSQFINGLLNEMMHLPPSE